MTTADNQGDRLSLIHTKLQLAQPLVLPLGKSSDLSQWTEGQNSIYLHIAGISGASEGITLEVYLCAENTSILLSAEGLYGLRNASQSSDGLSICTEISAGLVQFCQLCLSTDSNCSLLVQPRYKLKEKESLQIKQLSFSASGCTR